MDDLHLGQQEVGERQRLTGNVEAAAQVELVAHVEAIDEHVELAAAHRVVVRRRFLVVRPCTRVQLLERPVALRDEEPSELLAISAASHEIDVAVAAGERLVPGARAAQRDRDAAE